MENKLELRMYGFVPYNISEIQKGIQFGHAVVELCQKLRSHEEWRYELKKYDEWANENKTFIILNGGTSNHSVNRYICDPGFFEFTGSMELHLKFLNELGVTTGEFYEPDLNDMLSAIVFIADERIFNKKDYPDLEDFIRINYLSMLSNNYSPKQAAEEIKNSNFERDKRIYAKWLSLIGGEKNAQLREFLKNFRLA